MVSVKAIKTNENLVLSHFDYTTQQCLNSVNANNKLYLFEVSTYNQVTPFDVVLDVFSFTMNSIVTPIIALILVFLALQNIYFRYASNKFKASVNTITTLIVNLLSYYEVVVITTSFFFIIILKLVLSVTEEDSYDLVALMILFFIVLLLISFYVSIGTIKSYFLLNSNSSGEVKKRLLFNEFVNTFLCVLRIFLCLTRYIFYDLQVELVDMVLNYTEDVNYLTSSGLDNLSLLDILIAKVFDIFIFILSIVICLIKFSISLFLL